MTRERKKSTLAVIIIILLFALMGYVEAWPDTIVVVPSSGEQERDSSTVIVDQKDGGQKMIHCLSTETGLVYCIEL